jgi:MFS family permease
MTERRGLGANYWKLMGSSVLGNVGDGIAAVALPWYASTLTSDPLLIAAVGVASRLPWLLLALVAGVVGDRVDRRRLMVTAATTKATMLVALAGMIVADVGSIGVVIAVALAVGTCEVFFDNTAQTMLPSVVPKDRLERANGTMWGAEAVANGFVGPPLGGVLIAASLWLPFASQAVLVVLAALMLATMRGSFRAAGASTLAGPTVAGQTPGIRVMLGEGLRWLWHHRMLRNLAFALGTVNGASALAQAVVVLFAREVLDLSAAAFGAVLTAAAIGAIIGSVIGPSLATRIAPGATIAIVLGGQVVVMVAIALVPVVAVFAAGEVLLAVGAVWWNVVTVSLRQRIIPDRLMSRVNSAYRTLGWGIIPVGTALGGLVVTFAEPVVGRDAALRAPYVVAAAITLALLVFASRTLTTSIIRKAEADADAVDSTETGDDYSRST